MVGKIVVAVLCVVLVARVVFLVRKESMADPQPPTYSDPMYVRVDFRNTQGLDTESYSWLD